MPFHHLHHSPSLGGQLHWTSVCFANQHEGGDGLFVETDRNDGRTLLLLIDIEGHGDEVACRLNDLASPAHLGHQDCQNLFPAELLLELHSLMGIVWAMNSLMTDQEWCAEALAFLLPAGDEDVVLSRAGLIHPWIGSQDAWSPWNPDANLQLGVYSMRGNRLGPAHGLEYSNHSHSIAPGDLLLGFTDGVGEAGVRSDRTPFQGGRLEEFLRQAGTHLPPAALLEALFAELQAYEGDRWPGDDVTAFCWRRP